jgi:hypothetical protein
MNDNNDGRDKRVVYGAVCTYWGSIYSIATLPVDGDPDMALPVCPHCNRPLFEMDTEEDFLVSAAAHEANGHSGYLDFIIWAKGRKCYPSMEIMLAEYTIDTGKTASA